MLVASNTLQKIYIEMSHNELYLDYLDLSSSDYMRKNCNTH